MKKKKVFDIEKIKETIMNLESGDNWFVGKIVNLKINSNMVICDVVFYNDMEQIEERYNNCEYDLDDLKKVSKVN